MPHTKHLKIYLILMLLAVMLLAASAGADTVQPNETSFQGIEQTSSLSFNKYLGTTTTPISATKHVFVNVANTAGVKYTQDGAHYGGTGYYMKFDGGGVNALHISTDPSISYGQVTTSTSQSGSFFLTDTGGRGFDDDGILMLAVKGDVPDDFSLHIRASGYTWTPSTVANEKPTAYRYVDGTVDETFSKSDFAYGPQNWKPCSTSNYPIYNGQDMSDTTQQFQLMFIDLNAGVIGMNTTAGAPPLANNGAIRVEYSFENLNTFAAFDAYAWCLNSNQGEGITWTNAVAALGQSPTSANGYTVTGVPRPTTTPTPIPTPYASFTANRTNGPYPLSVGFSDTSTGSPTTWSWNFGDGNISTVQNPVHTYTTAGTYTVALTSTNAGGSNTSTETGYITVTTPVTPTPTTLVTTSATTVTSTPTPPIVIPTTIATTITTTVTTTAATVVPTTTATMEPLVTNFTANVTAGLSPLTVQYTDLTTSKVQQYFWQFGDGSTSIDRNPVHTYSTVGRYTVSLIAIGPAGTQVKTVEQYITVTAPGTPGSIPPETRPPLDLNGDGRYEDLNGNGVLDFNDVVLFFNQMDWIAENEPIGVFDFNKNGSIDFNDVVVLFNMI